MSGTLTIGNETLFTHSDSTGMSYGSGIPDGSVIQTVYNQTNSPTNITGTSLGSGTTTGLSVNITPISTSNKLLIIYRGSLALAQHANPGVSVEIHDGSSVVVSEDGSWGVYINGDGNEYDNQYHYTLIGYITPASAGSAITYTVRAWKYGNNCTFQIANRTSDIMIQEIKQ
jgi:hypothetical protein